MRSSTLPREQTHILDSFIGPLNLIEEDKDTGTYLSGP